jgi:RNA polymerase sigma-70 factor (ECF subfamily)
MTDSPTPSDQDLLARIRSSDGQAMRVLIDRHGQYLYGVARVLTRSETEAEDAVQETLMASMSARFEGRSSVRTFLVSILVRQAAQLRRKRRGWLRIVPDVPEARSTRDASLASDAKLDLAILLEKLSPEHREVLVMRELEQMTYEQIAHAIGVPRGTVESRLFRAREQLRELWNR